MVWINVPLHPMLKLFSAPTAGSFELAMTYRERNFLHLPAANPAAQVRSARNQTINPRIPFCKGLWHRNYMATGCNTAPTDAGGFSKANLEVLFYLARARFAYRARRQRPGLQINQTSLTPRWHNKVVDINGPPLARCIHLAVCDASKEQKPKKKRWS